MALAKKKVFSIIASVLFIIVMMWLFFYGCGSSDLPRSVYYIGRDNYWYPLDLRGKEKNMSGFTGDLLEIIGKDEGFRTIIINSGPTNLRSDLVSGRYDAVFSSIPPTPQNKGIYGFSDIIYRTGPVLIIPENSTIKTIEDLKQKVIGIETNTLSTFSVPASFNTILIPYDSATAALDNLDRNIIDGVILDVLKAYVYTQGYYSGSLKVSDIVLTNTGLRLITRNDPESLIFLNHFNDGLKKIKEEGIFKQLIEKWDLTNTD